MLSAMRKLSVMMKWREESNAIAWMATLEMALHFALVHNCIISGVMCLQNIAISNHCQEVVIHKIMCW